LGVFRNLDDKKEELTLKEFEEAFAQYYTSVRNFLYFKTSNTDLAEDIAQDAFVKLWETRKNIKKASLKSYIYTIANNLAINQLKRNQLKYKFINLQEDRSNQETPEYLLEMKEFDAKLQDTLALIPDGAREVFLMNRIEGMKYHEIADRLGLSTKAIEKRMSKALGILRENLERKV
jgi:RNA polymerase sigma-70 factor (ECF subfamily)